MRLTGLGKLVMLLLVAGIAVGAWRWWSQMRASPTAPATPNGPSAKVPPLGEAPPTTNAGGVEITFVTTAAKQDWASEQVKAFNQAHAGKWNIVVSPSPSREAMHNILAGKSKPVLWSPGSPIWPARLAEAWPENHPGETVLDMSDPNAYRVYLRSPLVFLTTRQRAAALKGPLGGTKPWAALRDLSLGKRPMPGGRFRFSHADPLTSSSGMLTLGLTMLEYAGANGQSGNLSKVAVDRRFIAYLKEMEKALVYDADAEKGTTALTKAFLADPNRYDFITAYESAALEAAAKNPDLAVIYPTPTAESEHAVSLLSGPWVTPEQREGAMAFLQFLGSKPAIQSGIRYFFRPAQASGALSLASQLQAHESQGFQQSYSRVELPPYTALNSAAYQWRIHVAHKPIPPSP